MKRTILAACLALITAGQVDATPQRPDLVTYTGVVYRLDTPVPNRQLPLDVLWQGSTNRPAVSEGPRGLMSTACYRGYVATWSVDDDILYLTGIDAWVNDKKADLQVLFPDRFQNGKVKADWFTGTLTLWSKAGGPGNVPVTLNFEKGKRTPNQTSDGIRQPADGLPKPSR